MKTPDYVSGAPFISVLLSLHIHRGESQHDVPTGGLTERASWFKGSEDESIVDLHAKRIGIVAGEDAIVLHASSRIDAGFDQNWTIDTLNLVRSGGEPRGRIEGSGNIVSHFGTRKTSDEHAEHDYRSD